MTIIEKKISAYKNSPLASSTEEKERVEKCLKTVLNVKNDTSHSSYTKRMIIEKAKVHNLI